MKIYRNFFLLIAIISISFMIAGCSSSKSTDISKPVETTSNSSNYSEEETKARASAEAYCSILKAKQKNIVSMKYLKIESISNNEFKFLFEVEFSNLSYTRPGIITVVKTNSESFETTGLKFID